MKGLEEEALDRWSGGEQQDSGRSSRKQAVKRETAQKTERRLEKGLMEKKDMLDGKSGEE